jgi:hypothetical protein
MRSLFLIIAVLIPSGSAAQPYSNSMADCAGIYQNAAQWVTTDSAAGQMMYATTQWADAAIAQAEGEGVDNPEQSMWPRIDQRTTEWEARGSGVYFTQEFRDWMQYCRSFAKNQGINITQ